MHKAEASTTPNPNYMVQQKELNENVRAILIDWIFEVHMKFKLLPESLFLTVNVIDRYLALT